MNRYLITYNSEVTSGNTKISSELDIHDLHDAIKKAGYFFVEGTETTTNEKVTMVIPYHSIRWIKLLHNEQIT